MIGLRGTSSWRLGAAQEVVIDEEPAEPELFLEGRRPALPRSFDVRTRDVILDHAVTDQAWFVTVGGGVVLAQTPDGAGPSASTLDPITGDPALEHVVRRPTTPAGSACAGRYS